MRARAEARNMEVNNSNDWTWAMTFIKELPMP